MLNISGLSQYMHSLADDKQNHITNIFLANSQNQILITLKNKANQYSILGTLLNDSLYILKLDFSSQQQQSQSSIVDPIEIILQTEEQQMIYLFNIENHFIYGVVVKKQDIQKSRNIVKQSYHIIKTQLVKTIKWMDIEKDNY